MLSETERGVLLQTALGQKKVFTIYGPGIDYLGPNFYIEEITKSVIDAVNIAEITNNNVTIIFTGTGATDSEYRQLFENLIRNIVEGIHSGGIESDGDVGFNVYSILTGVSIAITIEPPESTE